jgi:hypothetical protein
VPAEELELWPNSSRGAAHVQCQPRAATGCPRRRVHRRHRAWPYRLTDLSSLIEQRIGKLDNRAQRPVYSRVLARIESLTSDARYSFMFEQANVGGDTMASVLSGAVPPAYKGRPMTIMQLAGFPSEVVDAVVSVLGRWRSISACGAMARCRCCSSRKRRTGTRRPTTI